LNSTGARIPKRLAWNHTQHSLRAFAVALAGGSYYNSTAFAAAAKSGSGFTHAMLIRRANESDANAISQLLSELSHPLEPNLVGKRISELNGLVPTYALFVAAVDGRVIGVVAGFASPVLHYAEPVGRISVLAIASSHSGSGVGSALLLHVEGFLKQQGCERIEVTSAAHRHLAHDFYRHRGYEQQGVRFAKKLTGR
jgi:predicted N-acetyltransferase YhbS